MGKKSAPVARRPRPSAPKGPSALEELRSRYGWPTLLLCSAIVVLRYALPWLASLTPPGVDIELIRTHADRSQPGIHANCENPCTGFKCPAEWKTSRCPIEHCKCICVRATPGVKTQWEKDREAGRMAMPYRSQAAWEEAARMYRATTGRDATGAWAGAGCEGSCDNMACPAGWKTARAPDDECRCICVRSSPGEQTQWDIDRAKAKAAAALAEAASRDASSKAPAQEAAAGRDGAGAVKTPHPEELPQPQADEPVIHGDAGPALHVMAEERREQQPLAEHEGEL